MFRHQKIIDTLRKLDPKEFKTIRNWIDPLTDQDAIKKMFRNVRISELEIRGERLNAHGTKILKQLYSSWEIKLNHPLTMRQQLRFGRACRLPYYYGEDTLVCFEKEVGVWLAMIQNDIDLMDNVLPEY